MKVSVWDTYVVKQNGATMHFDIIVPDHIKEAPVVHEFGKQYLVTKGQQQQSLTAKECQFCHIEAATPEMEQAIAQQGYYIIEMEGC